MLDANLTTNCRLHDWWVLQLGDSVKPLSAEKSGKKERRNLKSHALVSKMATILQPAGLLSVLSLAAN